MSRTDNWQSQMWRGPFGDQYSQRNACSEDQVRDRLRGFADIFTHMNSDPPATILECGSNVGLNLRALQRHSSATLFAIEPNARAREVAVSEGVVAPENMRDATLFRLPFDDASVDLVFTTGVLIHVPPDALDRAYSEMYRVSSRYLLTMEYFSVKPETLPYRGHDDLLFKRDFGGKWLDMYADLDCIAQGFLWSRTTGFDDLTWWLFRKV